MPPAGQPLRIMSKNGNTKKFELDEEALKSVLLRDDVKDKPVCVVAVAGGFRKGKSFLLNYFLRYCANRGRDDWLSDPSEPLKGFSWINSSERETTGILLWSEPFIIKLSGTEEVAIILMDTQGTFDPESSIKESTVVFALSLLTSSVLVYNLKENIGGDDLMHLDTFTQYGLLAREENDAKKPFQKILFLVRDWNNSHEMPYGLQGGKKLLNKRLEIKPEQDADHQDLRRNLKKCFTNTSCYLMPHPGRRATQRKSFDGRQSELSTKFVGHLKLLVPMLLAPENIKLKTLAGRPIKTKDLFNNFKIYIEAFNAEDLPAPTTVAQSIARASCAGAARSGIDRYKSGMDKIIQPMRQLGADELETQHSFWTKNALELYRIRSQHTNQRICTSYEHKFENDLGTLFQQYKILNMASCTENSKGDREKATKELNSLYTKLSFGLAGVLVGATIVAGAPALMTALPALPEIEVGPLAIAALDRVLNAVPLIAWTSQFFRSSATNENESKNSSTRNKNREHEDDARSTASGREGNTRAIMGSDGSQSSSLLQEDTESPSDASAIKEINKNVRTRRQIQKRDGNALIRNPRRPIHQYPRFRAALSLSSLSSSDVASNISESDVESVISVSDVESVISVSDVESVLSVSDVESVTTLRDDDSDITLSDAESEKNSVKTVE